MGAKSLAAYLLMKMTNPSPSLEVFQSQEDIKSGWYLLRFGRGQKMVIPLKPVSYLGRYLCDSKLVSDKHAAFHLLENGEWILWPIDSKRGTFVNDARVPKDGVLLREYDIICLGRKRPKNVQEFGFMLRFKPKFSYAEDCSSDSVANSEKSSLSSGHSAMRVKNKSDPEQDSDESTKHKSSHSSILSSESRRKQPAQKLIRNKKGSSSSSSSSSSVAQKSTSARGNPGKSKKRTDTCSSNDSERTVRFAKNCVQSKQPSESSLKKVSDWLSNIDSSSSEKRRKSLRKNRNIKRSSFSDDLPSDKPRRRKRYETRHKDNPVNSMEILFGSSDTGSSVAPPPSDDSSNDELSQKQERAREHSKRDHKLVLPGKTDRYYVDNTWRPSRFVSVESPRQESDSDTSDSENLHSECSSKKKKKKKKVSHEKHRSHRKSEPDDVWRPSRR